MLSGTFLMGNYALYIYIYKKVYYFFLKRLIKYFFPALIDCFIYISLDIY
jgi:hypothetical protein